MPVVLVVWEDVSEGRTFPLTPAEEKGARREGWASPVTWECGRCVNVVGSSSDEAATPCLSCSLGPWNIFPLLFGILFATFYFEIIIDSEVAKKKSTERTPCILPLASPMKTSYITIVPC